MNVVAKSMITLLLTAFSIVGCSSSPELQKDPYNSADEQRSRAQQAQDELSSETSRE